MFSKLKDLIINSKGPFTKEGALLDYTEIHVFLNGMAYGLRQTTAETGWKKLKAREEGAAQEYTYYHYGYLIGNRSKVGLIGAGVGAGAYSSGILK